MNVKLVGKMKMEEDILPSSPCQRNILIECQKCYKLFQNPITLSCGFTLCYDCIPKTDHFQCLSFNCLRTHSIDSLTSNVILKEILENLNSMDKIHQLLTCSICLQRFEDPVTTECGHTFCKECLIHVITDIKNRACPICRHELNRIGHIDQTLMSWIQHINHESTPVFNKYIPIMKLAYPISLDQDYLFYLNEDEQTCIFKEMLNQPFQSHYVISLYKNDSIMLIIKHIEYSKDIRRFVLQAHSLYNLHINLDTYKSPDTLSNNLHIQRRPISMISPTNHHRRKSWIKPLSSPPIQ